MKSSLSARVAAGLVIQSVVFCGAMLYLALTADSLLVGVSVLKEDLAPAVEDLNRLVMETKATEDQLASNRPGDVERARGQVARLRPFERLREAAAVLRTAATSGGVGEARAEDLVDAADAATAAAAMERRPMAGADPTIPRNAEEAIAVLLQRMETAVKSGATGEAEAESRELLRTLRFVRGGELRTHRMALAALQEAEHDLVTRRSELSLVVIIVSAAALVTALVVLLLSLQALRPVGYLVTAIRRLAGGDYSPVTIRSPKELADLSDALNSLAQELSRRATEQERAQEERMRTERLAVVGRMASVVAHEVRNPLNSIALNVDLLHEMLQAPDRGGKRAGEVLGSVQREVDRLSEITEEYLRFGRMPKGVLSPIDAVGVVRDTRTFMAEELAIAGVEVQAWLPDEPVRVITDEGQLRQALVNVIRNAVEAMPGGGRLTLAVRAEGDRAVVEVTDTGTGIPESFRARLFEPFATTKPRGTGLGLAFVQQVAQESGGDVGIESKEGKGTSVRLRLRRA